MVAMSINILEWGIFLSPCNTICTSLFRCLWVVWLWGILLQLMVSSPMAYGLGRHRDSSKGACSDNCVCTLVGTTLDGRHVRFHSDNEAVVTIIQRRRAKHPLLSHLLRCLFFYAATFRFHFSAVHIPGTSNVVADAISRNNLSLLSSLLPQATRMSIPASVSEFLLSLPDWGSPIWTDKFMHSLSSVCPHPQPGAITPEFVVI